MHCHYIYHYYCLDHYHYRYNIYHFNHFIKIIIIIVKIFNDIIIIITAVITIVAFAVIIIFFITNIIYSIFFHLFSKPFSSKLRERKKYLLFSIFIDLSFILTSIFFTRLLYFLPPLIAFQSTSCFEYHICRVFFCGGGIPFDIKRELLPLHAISGSHLSFREHIYQAKLFHALTYKI